MNTKFVSEYKSLIKTFFLVVPSFLKYQIITKILLAGLIFPLFWTVTDFLMKSKGLFAVSNGDFMNFLLSLEGFLFLLLFIGLTFLVILLEIGGYIVLSTRSLWGEKESGFKEILKYNFRLFPTLFGSGSFLLLFYILVMIPLTGVNVSASFLQNIKIPNFITSVIYDNRLYNALYLLVLFLFAILSFQWIFTFHFIVIGGEKPALAMKKSRRLLRGNKKEFLTKFLVIGAFHGVILISIFLLQIILAKALLQMLTVEKLGSRVLVFTMLFIKNTLLSAISLFVIPFEVHHLTVIFYKFCKRTEGFKEIGASFPEILEKTKPSVLDLLLKKKRSFFALFFIAISITSIFSGVFFEQLFIEKIERKVVGHRGGGGFLVPENSLSSVAKSIEYGADFVEIDVQRTKDGFYIISHDKTFKRMAGENRKPIEMTVSEIKALDIGKFYPGYEGERVPTIEELLDFCKGRIGVFVELKGETADEKMVDDMVSLIKERKMEKETVLMSLDYKLMEYAEKKYKEMETGFTYFLAFGDLGSFQSSHLILEEEAATKKALKRIHAAGKKAVVWTVNKQSSMEKFIKEDVDAIITDDVKALTELIEREKEKGTLELLLEAFSKLP